MSLLTRSGWGLEEGLITAAFNTSNSLCPTMSGLSRRSTFCGAKLSSGLCKTS